MESNVTSVPGKSPGVKSTFGFQAPALLILSSMLPETCLLHASSYPPTSPPQPPVLHPFPRDRLAHLEPPGSPAKMRASPRQEGRRCPVTLSKFPSKTCTGSSLVPLSHLVMATTLLVLFTIIKQIRRGCRDRINTGAGGLDPRTNLDSVRMNE